MQPRLAFGFQYRAGWARVGPAVVQFRTFAAVETDRNPGFGMHLVQVAGECRVDMVADVFGDVAAVAVHPKLLGKTLVYAQFAFHAMRDYCTNLNLIAFSAELID